MSRQTKHYKTKKIYKNKHKKSQKGSGKILNKLFKRRNPSYRQLTNNTNNTNTPPIPPPRTSTKYQNRTLPPIPQKTSNSGYEYVSREALKKLTTSNNEPIYEEIGVSNPRQLHIINNNSSEA